MISKKKVLTRFIGRSEKTVISTVIFSAFSFMEETECRKKELLPAAFVQMNLTKMEDLLKQGADPSEIRPQHMAIMVKHEDFIIKTLNFDEIQDQNSSTIIQMFVAKDAELIRTFLSFISKYFYETFQISSLELTRSVRPGFEKFVSRDEILFYLQKLPILDNRSIIQYIVEGGNDMIVLREQLLDLMVKIDRKIYLEDFDSSENRLIDSVKRDIPSSRNLSKCLESIEKRYRWVPFKKLVHITKSFVSNIVFGFTLYLLDLGTDASYSHEMYQTNATGVCHENFEKTQNKAFDNIVRYLATDVVSCLEIYGANATTGLCQENFEKMFNKTLANISTRNSSDGGSMDCLDDSIYLQQGLIGYAHVIAPPTFVLLIELLYFSTKGTLPYWTYGPLFTRGYRFYLDIKYALFKGREEPTEDDQDQNLMKNNEKRDEEAQDMMREMKVNNRDMLMAQQIECIGESSFQFFMQTLWLMPTLLMLWWDKVSIVETVNLDELFNMRTLSLAISFLTMGISYTNIRLYL